MPIERFRLPHVSPNPNVLRALAVLLFFVNTAYPQVSPYITDVVGEDGVVVHAGGGDDDDLRLIGTFKLFNPDTIPFYLWLSFENGGRLAHYRSGRDSPAVRLVNMELRYRDASYRPIVKEFPDNAGPRVRSRLGWTSPPQSGSQRRFGRKKSHVELSENTASSVRHRSRGAVELVFWQEEAQGYYEMELWGVLYAPDLKKVVVKGRYIENIKLEVEPALK